MKRKIYNTLQEWKDQKDHLPLLIIGARQVGKTYIINEFCQNTYQNYFKLNLKEDNRLIEIYKENIVAEERLNKLKNYLAFGEENKDTIIFIDEVQESEEFISDLKYINENHPQLNIICAGSLLGVKLNRLHTSFPVGRVKMIDMFPMDFEEFLMAFDLDYLINEIKVCFANNKKMMESYHLKALNMYYLYLCIGGMPACVEDIINKKENITLYDKNILTNIIDSYLDDMNYYVENKSETMKIEELYLSIPSQLGNASHKFQVTKINKDAKMRNYRLPIDWLLASRLIRKTENVKNPEAPLKLFIDNDTFKFYFSDVGILTNQLEIDYKDIIFNYLKIGKGILAENYVANELSFNNIPLYYLKGKESEIDFLLSCKDGIIPIEVKASENTQSKSLKNYIEQYKPKYGIRISTKNFGFVNGIKSIPLYAAFCITKD